MQAAPGPANGTDDTPRQGAESSVQTVYGLPAKCEVDSIATTTRVPARCKALALKLSCTVNASCDEVCDRTFTVDWQKKLGNGTFGEVFEGRQCGTGAPVAVKTFQINPSGKSFAMKEVCALSTFQPHPCLLTLVDVGRVDDRICLVTDKYDTDLGGLLRIRKLQQDELHHILRCICDGLAHLHGAGVCHNDLKPSNVLLRLGPAPPADTASTTEFAKWILQMRNIMQVVIADLGNAIPSDSSQRPCLSQGHVSKAGVEEVTLWYRAPEILLGLAGFDSAADMWSLGCIAAELLRRKPLFQGGSQVDMGMKIFRALGTPLLIDMQRISRRKEPLLASVLPAFLAKSWPPDWLLDGPPHFDAILAQLLKVDPAHRMTARDALAHEFFQPQQLTTVMSAVACGQGLASMQQDTVDPILLRWLQADQHWAEICEHCLQTDFKDGVEPGLKHEDSGYIRTYPPHTKKINTQDASQPCRSRRLRQFMQVFLEYNKNWLTKLTSLVHGVLRSYPTQFLGDNGAEFLERCFSDTAFAYTTEQVMRPTERCDDKHFDGGASLLHIGFTLFGSRVLKCFHADGTSTLHPQSPGSIYVGNMCAVEHSVSHGLNKAPGGDVGGDSEGDHGGPEGGSDVGLYEGQLGVAVMIRSDVFANTRARKMKGKPTPIDVFDLVNKVVAQHLATNPLTLPDFASVAGAAPVPDYVPAANGASASGAAPAPSTVPKPSAAAPPGAGEVGRCTKRRRTVKRIE